MATVTSSEIAHTLGKLDKLGYKSTSRIHRQVRHLHMKGLLRSVGESDERGTATFEPETVVRARILIVLAEMHFDVRTLKEVVEAMRRHPLDFVAPSMRQEGAFRSEGGLKDAIRGIKAGESWSLKITLKVVAGTEEKIFGAHFVWDGEPKNPEADKLLEAYASARGETIQAATIVPLNSLLEPLLED